MLKGLLVTVVLVLAVVTVAGAAGPELKSDEQKTLYALGFVISQNLASFALSPADLEVVLAGVNDGVLKKDSKVDVQTYGPKIPALQTARASAAATVEKKAGQAFLDKAAAETGPRRTPPARTTRPARPGNGARPKAPTGARGHTRARPPT